VRSSDGGPVPGATFGWPSHPGPTIVTVLSGTLTLYHAEHCTVGIAFGPGTSFSNLPDEIHLAKNEGSTDLVVYASCFVPVRTPPVLLRIDQRHRETSARSRRLNGVGRSVRRSTPWRRHPLSARQRSLRDIPAVLTDGVCYR
jgi:hypothetical protein